MILWYDNVINAKSILILLYHIKYIKKYTKNIKYIILNIAKYIPKNIPNMKYKLCSPNIYKLKILNILKY